MTLDIDPPNPPELAAVDPNEYEDTEVAGGEYRHDELEVFLREGAWEAAFDEWVADSDTDEADWRVALDLELVFRFDFWGNNRTTRRLFYSKSGRSSGAS